MQANPALLETHGAAGQIQAIGAQRLFGPMGAVIGGQHLKRPSELCLERV
jgi:hypothetical protein